MRGADFRAGGGSRGFGWLFAALAAALFGLKLRAILEAGPDVPAGLRWLEELAAPFRLGNWRVALDAGVTALNGQWDPFLIRLVHAAVETAVIIAVLAFIVRAAARRSGRAALAVFALGGAAQIVAALAGPPAWFETAREPWVITLGCTLLLPAVFGRPAPRRTAALAILIAVAAAFWNFCAPPAADPPAPQNVSRGEGVRRYLSSGDAAGLQARLALSPADTRRAEDLLASPRVRARLPAIARLPLPLAPETAQSAEAFQAGGAPELFPGTGDLPGWGTWAASGVRQGRFVSQPLRTDFPLLRFEVAGTLAAPENTLAAQPIGGDEIAPLQTRLESPSQWRHLNLDAPSGPFRIVARGGLPGAWLAITAPVEYGRGSWLAGKLVAEWPLWLGIAAALAVLAIPAVKAAYADAAPAEAPGRPRDWAAAERRIWPWLALFTYGCLLAPYLDTYAGGSDSSGYLNSARLLREGQLTAPVPRPAGADFAALDPAVFVPRGFDPRGRDRMAPTYPVGLPLLFCAAGFVLPARAAVPAVILLHLLAGIWLTFELARCLGLSRGGALFAGLLLAGSPLYIFMGLQPMSDVPALVWVLAAIVSACRARDRPALAIVAGLATGMAVMVRPTNALAVIPILIALGGSPRRLAFWVLGGIPAALAEGTYNAALYGHFFVTGYGNPLFLFSREWLLPTWAHYLHWIPVLITPLAALAPGLLWIRSVALRDRLLLGVWVAAYLIFYSFYSCTHETWWYLRFLLPAVPPLIVAGLLVGRAAVARIRFPRFVAVLGVAAAAGWLTVQDATLDALYSGRGNRVYPDSAAWLERHAPADAIVACSQTSGAIYYYSRFAFAAPADRPGAEAVAAIARRAGRPLYGVYFDYEAPLRDDFTGGRWNRVDTEGAVGVWLWTPSS